MARRYMVGTVSDHPLLEVVVDGLKYFLDLDTQEVVADKPGLPQVTDKELVTRILKAEKEIN